MSRKSSILLGIDIGGTKISVCVGNTEGKIYSAQRAPVAEVADSYSAGLAKIKSLANKALTEAGYSLSEISGVGIAAPAPMDNKKGILLSPTNLKGWGSAPIVADISRETGKPTRMFNDANACAMAEFQFGSGRGIQNMVYLTNSTGMGGGIIIQGRLLEGNDDTAGEVGHFVLNPEGPCCACGQNGCFEAYCGGLSLAQRIQQRIQTEKIKTRILDHADGDISKIAMPALLSALREQDEFAREIWDEYVMRMAQGIGIIIMTLNPELVILGTIAIHAGDLLMKPLLKQLPEFAWPAPRKACRITVSQLGAAIGDYSALAAAMNE